MLSGGGGHICLFQSPYFAISATSDRPVSLNHNFVASPLRLYPILQTRITGYVCLHSGVHRTRTYTAFLQDGLASRCATVTPIPHTAVCRNRTHYAVKRRSFQDCFRPFGYTAYISFKMGQKALCSRPAYRLRRFKEKLINFAYICLPVSIFAIG